MTLPLSGPLSLGDINVELGRSRTSLVGIKEAEYGDYIPLNPYSPYKPNEYVECYFSEWYGYDQNYAPPSAPMEIYGDFYDTPYIGDNWLQITDLDVDEMILDYRPAPGSGNDWVNGLPLNLVIGHTYRFNLLREDLVGQYPDGFVNMQMNDSALTVDQYADGYFSYPSANYCQATFDVLIPNGNLFYLYFTTGY